LQLNKQQREETQKTSRQMRKLFERLELLEKREADRLHYDGAVRAQIEDQMRREARNDSLVHLEEEAKLQSTYEKEVRFDLDSDSQESSSDLGDRVLEATPPKSLMSSPLPNNE